MIPHRIQHQVPNVLDVEDLRRQEESWEEEMDDLHATEETEPAEPPEEAA